MFLNLFVVIPVVVALIAMRWLKPNNLLWAIGWAVGTYLVVRFGLKTPIPASVVNIYMGIALLGIFSYAMSSKERVAATFDPIIDLVNRKSRRPLLAAVVLGIPTLVAANVFFKMNVPLEAPQFGRTVHPAAPNAISVGGASIDLDSSINPYDALKVSNPSLFASHVENGRRVYYENCFYCHGDEMDSKGIFSHGLNPIPTNFLDQNIIPNFQSSFFFWRIAKGAPGLPSEAGPWDSAMPAWDEFLTEEEVWDVLLYLSEFTGYTPRANVVDH